MRTRNLSHLALIALTLFGTASLASAAGGGKKDSQICLVRPDDGPDDNAKGTLRIREKGNGSSFEIHAIKVNADHEFHAWLEDPIDSDTFTDIGTLKGGGSQKLKFDTKKGDDLPLAAASLDELMGRRLEIRHGEDVVLKGTVPPFGLDKKPKKAEVTIDAEPGAPAEKMSLKLSLRSKADKGQERIELKAKKVPWDDGPFHVFVEDGVASDVFVDAGKLEQKGGSGGHWKRDTKQGQALPAGAEFVSELAGRRLEVRRTSDDLMYLSGEIPAVE